MHYSFEIRKFLYSQYFYSGLRIATGISLPAVLLLILNHRELGFTIATGALGAGIIDKPGPLKYKHNEMLACSAIGCLAVFATGLATSSVAALFATVSLLAFALSLVVVYGDQWPQISLATLLMMVITLHQRFTPLQALINAAWVLIGGLWYTYWCYLVSRSQWRRIEQQAIAEAIFGVADYLRARANCYDVDADLNESQRLLVAHQIDAVDKQDAARDLVLRNLPNFRAGSLDADRTILFNLFINAVDLHEMAVTSHTDYGLLRNTFGQADVLVFFRDLIGKIADDLDHIGLAVLQNRPSQLHLRIKAEMRAIEYELDAMRRKGMPVRKPEAYAMLAAAFRRVWSATRLVEKMHRNSCTAVERRLDGASLPSEVRIDGALGRFIQNRHFTPSQILSNLTIASPGFRHALRVTVAIALGFWLGRLLPLTNNYWIMLTSIVIMKPGFSLTRQRNTQRLIGTVIGCGLSVVLIMLVHQPPILLLLMFACMVMSYSLLLFNYGASAVFTSSYVLLLYHLLAPANMKIIGERAIDTLLGCVIAISVSYLFPYWEYRLMGPLIKKLLAATRNYLDAVWPPAPAAASPTGDNRTFAPLRWQGAPTQTVHEYGKEAQRRQRGGAKVLDKRHEQDEKGEVRYRLARKRMHVAFANLGSAFQRMMLEPKAVQWYVAELNDLLIQSHVLASHLATAAPLAAALGKPSEIAIVHAFKTVREKLAQAEAGRPSADDRIAETKALTRELDAMVLTAERSENGSTQTVQDLKLLAHQCKQMVAAAQQVARDATAIRLPD